jgi:hypothetical protein
MFARWNPRLLIYRPQQITHRFSDVAQIVGRGRFARKTVVR